MVMPEAKPDPHHRGPVYHRRRSDDNRSRGWVVDHRGRRWGHIHRSWRWRHIHGGRINGSRRGHVYRNSRGINGCRGNYDRRSHHRHPDTDAHCDTGIYHVSHTEEHCCCYNYPFHIPSRRAPSGNLQTPGHLFITFCLNTCREKIVLRLSIVGVQALTWMHFRWDGRLCVLD